ncbi:hypothetical protein NODU109028_21035 [Nocardioides dubius]|uniref:Glycosyltransferase RgtA/B/C/D-like domain-containing protein n=1 Tax=Nocardioides dubius TaxID=317019 RepID=A0ABN1TNM7_9ACTN
MSTVHRALDKLVELRARLPRIEIFLLVLVIAHVVLKFVLYPQVMDAKLIGDETSYVNGGRAFSNAVRDLVAGGGVDVAELQRNVISSGWFMPGMMLLLTPLFIVDPDASIAMIRGYLGVCSTLILLLAVSVVRRHLGDRYAVVLLIFPGLVPMWLLFSFAAWGDLTAGLLAVIFLALLVGALRSIREGVGITWRDGLKLGLLAITVVYFRSSASVLAVGLCLVVGLVILGFLRGKVRLRSFGAMVVAGVAFVGLLVPWSIAASETLGSRVLTTTSVANGTANTFGDRSQVCFGPCDAGSTLWFAPVRYSREVGRATGLGEVEVQEQMSEFARANVTPQSYSRQVLTNFGSYLFKPAGFAIHLQPPNSGENLAYWLIAISTNLLFFPMLAGALLMMLGIFRTSFDNRFLSLLLTLGLGSLMLQPFLHVAGARYWTTAAPMMAMATVLLGGELLARKRGHREALRPAGENHRSDAVLATWLDRAQWALAAGLVLTVAGLTILAVL